MDMRNNKRRYGFTHARVNVSQSEKTSHPQRGGGKFETILTTGVCVRFVCVCVCVRFVCVGVCVGVCVCVCGGGGGVKRNDSNRIFIIGLLWLHGL